MRELLSPAAETPLLASWAQALRPSSLQQMLAAAARPEVISFALGLPAAELFPRDAFAEAAAHVLHSDPLAMQYQPAFAPLKRHVVALMAQRGVRCREEQVFLTTGAQQALNLLAHLLLEPRGQVMTEDLAYSGLLQAIAPFQPELLTVPTDPERGIDVDAVAAALAGGARPAFIYVISDGHNPLGVSLSAEQRAGLVELARRYQVPILEDDAYGFLYYGETALPPLRALDEHWVLYAGSFSKILAPALRVGWLVVPEAFALPLSVIKESSDINTSTVTQRTITAYLDGGHLPAHVAALRAEYRRRRDAMLDALAAHFPPTARWNCPSSGMFIWVTLPPAVDAAALLEVAIEREQVAFIPGLNFCVGERRHAASCMRLNFSNSSPERIEEGIARLARVLRMG